MLGRQPLFTPARYLEHVVSLLSFKSLSTINPTLTTNHQWDSDVDMASKWHPLHNSTVLQCIANTSFTVTVHCKRTQAHSLSMILNQCQGLTFAIIIWILTKLGLILKQCQAVDFQLNQDVTKNIVMMDFSDVRISG